MANGQWRKSVIIILSIILAGQLFFHPEIIDFSLTNNTAALLNFVQKSIPASKLPLNGYITSKLYTVDVKAGLGNQMYEISSLYGIAAALNMTPFVLPRLAERVKSLKEEFPFLNVQLCNISSLESVKFSDVKGSTFHNVELLRNYTSRNVTLDGTYFQSYRYFHHIRPQIKEMFSFSSTAINTAKELVSDIRKEFHLRIFNETGEPKSIVPVCVHIRRGDFVRDPVLLESRKEFIIPAVNYIQEELHKKRLDSLIILLTNDRAWAKSLFPNDLNVFLPSCNASCPRTVDLALMAYECETILLTASGSTFGFWGAYFSDKATVYYNEEYAKGKNNWYFNGFTPKDVFLSSWIPLKFNTTTTTPTTTTTKATTKTATATITTPSITSTTTTTTTTTTTPSSSTVTRKSLTDVAASTSTNLSTNTLTSKNNTLG